MMLHVYTVFIRGGREYYHTRDGKRISKSAFNDAQKYAKNGFSRGRNLKEKREEVFFTSEK